MNSSLTLAQRLYEAADIKINSSQRDELFHDTNAFASNAQKTSIASAYDSSIQKTNCTFNLNYSFQNSGLNSINAFIQDFNRFRYSELDFIAKWISTHTSRCASTIVNTHGFCDSKGKFRTYKTYKLQQVFSGAAVWFTRMVDTLVSIRADCLGMKADEDKQMEKLRYTCSIVRLLKNNEQEPDITTIEKDLLSDLPLEDLKSIKGTSKKNYEIINKIFASKYEKGDLKITNPSFFVPLIERKYLESFRDLNFSEMQYSPSDEEMEIISHFSTRLGTLIAIEAPITDLSVSSLSLMTSLQKLNLSGCDKILDFSFLIKLIGLTALNLSLTHFTHVSDLKDCTSLEYLSICECSQIEDYSPLFELPNLKEIHVSKSQMDEITLDALRAKGINIDDSYDHEATLRQQEFAEALNDIAYRVNSYYNF